jgi:hypothetical protein
MSLIIPANTLASGGYAVDNSCRFNDGSSDYLNRTPSAGNRKTWTWSGWVKRSKLGSLQEITIAKDGGSNYSQIYFSSTDILNCDFYTSGSQITDLVTTQVFRDVSAWYHLVIAVDTTDATSGDRVKIYVNGNRITSFSTATYPSLNDDTVYNSNVNHAIGYSPVDTNYAFGGYLAEVVFIDGTANAVTDFGEFDEDSGIWKPIDVSGLTFGTNGFYLDFEDSAALGDDVSGNGNDFTVNNLTAIDQTTDTPTNNFATLNPLAGSTSSPTLSEGNLKIASNVDDYQASVGTIGIPITGNWYWECKVLQTVNGSSGEGFLGIILESAYAASSDNKQTGQGVYTKNSANNFVADDIVSFQVDRTSNTLNLFKNGSGTANFTKTSVPVETIFPYVSLYGNGTSSVSWNFGNAPYAISSGNTDGNGYGNFEYAVPSGYLSLCTSNLSGVL